MLDEEEYASVHRLYAEAMRLPLRKSQEDRFAPLLKRYAELTGMKESNHNAVMHHRLSLYGPPCRACGEPLRTPRAKYCGACMATVESQVQTV